MTRDDKRKIRVSFRKNRSTKARQNDWTKARDDDAADAVSSERLSGKGDLTRRRTVVTSAANADGLRVPVRCPIRTDEQRLKIPKSAGGAGGNDFELRAV